MADQDAPYTPVHIAARDIPPPSTISPAARKALSDGAAAPAMSWPAADDKEAWRKSAEGSEAMWAERAAPILASIAATIETTIIGGVPCHDCRPSEGVLAEGAVYLFIHGGAFVVGGGTFAKVLGARASVALGMRTVSVDYRLAPDHPFPAGPLDCVAVYEALLATTDARRIVIGGSSAGGNLAAAAILMIRDRGLPMPAGAVLLTPEVDLTESGDSFRTNAELDVVLKGWQQEANAAYAGGAPLTDPYVSPLFADFASGFPPTLIQTGTRDLFLSNSVLLHRKLRKAGIDADLHVWEAMPHGGFMFVEAPENDEISAEVAAFIRRVTA